MHTKTLMVSLVKVTSTILITGAIFFETWHLISGTMLVRSYGMLLVWVGRFAVGAHFIESLIAWAIAQAQDKPPLRHAIYTFFVGTVGLFELIDDERLPDFLKGVQEE